MKKAFVSLIAILGLTLALSASEGTRVSRSCPLGLDVGHVSMLTVHGFDVDLAPASIESMATATERINTLPSLRLCHAADACQAMTVTRHERTSGQRVTLAMPTYTMDLRKYATTHDTRARTAAYPRRT